MELRQYNWVVREFKICKVFSFYHSQRFRLDQTNLFKSNSLITFFCRELRVSKSSSSSLSKPKSYKPVMVKPSSTSQFSWMAKEI